MFTNIFLTFLGDVTVYADIVDFLLDFEIIKDRRVISERQIANIVQSSFQKVITRQSAAHSIIFVNLENCSNDIVKEELVRVTTEPVLKSHLEKTNAEAHAWIMRMRDANILNPIHDKDDNDGNNDDWNSDDEELKQIEAYKEANEKKTDKKLNKNSRSIKDSEHDNKIVVKQSNEDVKVVSKQLDNELLFNNNKQTSNQQKYHQETSNKENMLKDLSSSDTYKSTESLNNRTKIGFLRRMTTSFSKRSSSANDHKKSVEKYDDSKNQDSPKTSALKRNHSFSQISEKLATGSVKDKFESISNKHDEASPNHVRRMNKHDEASPNHVRRMNKHDEASPDHVRRMRHINGSTSTETFVAKSRKEIFMENPLNNRSISGSNFDVRSNFPFERGIASRSSSLSATDVRVNPANIRSSFKKNSGVSYLNFDKSRKKEEFFSNIEAEKKEISHENLDKPIKPVKRSNSSTVSKSTSFNAPTIASINRSNTVKSNTNKSFLSDNKRKDFRNKQLEVHESPRNQIKTKFNSSGGANSEFKDAFLDNDSSSVNSFLSQNKMESIVIDTELQQYNKDLVKIAAAFQNHESGFTIMDDSIENFMVTIVTQDLEESLNARLKLDDLYDYIRNRMILSKEEIFHVRSKLNFDMSVYFELLFRTMASHFNQVGCEVTTDQTHKKKICYLIHVKLKNHINDEMTDTFESTKMSYV